MSIPFEWARRQTFRGNRLLSSYTVTPRAYREPALARQMLPVTV